MGLVKKFRDLLNVRKLHERIDELENEIKSRPVISNDNFYQVSTPINLDGIMDEIAERVIDDFKPFLERHAVGCLKQAFKANGPNRNLYASTAFDPMTRTTVVHAEMPRLETRFEVYNRD